MITVFGLWHLGCVTASCCAEHFETVGLDLDISRINKLRQGKAPLFEPKLDALIQKGLKSGKLSFTSNPKKTLFKTKLLWVTFDTPVDKNDKADVDYVFRQLRKAIPYLRSDSVVIISSQLPVGSMRRLEHEFSRKKISFVYSPENLRLGNAIEIFKNQDRIVIGSRDQSPKKIIGHILEKFSANLIWMSPESAEMTKHAINSFFALSVGFANEVAQLCESLGADAHEVAYGMRSESRIGREAYLSPGGSFSGGTLARDVQFLISLGKRYKRKLYLIPAIKQSNDFHKSWSLLRLLQILGQLKNKKIAVLGLTYKPGTNTLRRSNAIELIQKLLALKALVYCFDPSISTPRSELSGTILARSEKEAAINSDALVIMTEWPEFKKLDWSFLLATMRTKVIIDQNRFCQTVIPSNTTDLIYASVGISLSHPNLANKIKVE